MGQAKRRGTFEERKAEARATKNELRQASMDFLRRLYSQKFN